MPHAFLLIAEVAFVESADKKAFLPGDERARIECGRVEFDQYAMNEVADFDRGDRRLRNIGDDANVNSLPFTPILMNEA
jgi:hypothetical protein